MIKNTFWLLLGEGLMKAFQYFINIVIARKLGVEDYGVFNDIFTFTQLFSVIADFGMSVVLVKELSKKEITEKEALKNSFLFKICLIFMILVLVLIYPLAKGDVTNIIPYIALAGYNTLQFGYVPFIYSFTRYKENFKFETVLKIINIFITGAVFIYFTRQPTVTTASLPYLVTPIIPSLIATIYIFRRNKLKLNELKLNFSFQHLKRYSSILLSSIALTLLTVIPSQFIAHESHFELGIFSASYKLVIPLTLIATIINTSLLPKLESYIKKKRSLLITLALVSVSIYLSLGFIFSPKIISILYGSEYAQADLVLKIVLIIPILVFMNQFTQNLLLTRGRDTFLQKTSILGIVLIVTLSILRALNFLNSVDPSVYFSFGIILTHLFVISFRLRGLLTK